MFLQLYFIFHSVAVYHTVIMAVWCVIVSINHYHRDPPQTSCNELWILLPVSSATHRSTTAACLFCGMKSCTGSMSSTGCATSWQYWHTVRYMGLLHSTWQASSRRRQRSLDVSTCDLLLNRNCCSTVPSEDVWLSSVFSGKSVSVECITRQSERSRADLDIFRRHLKTYFFTLY